MSVVSFDQVSKKYQLGEGAYSTLAERMGQLFARLRGSGRSPNPVDHELWALKEVSFDVGRGEVLGIIGPNGAGKTTTLKLLAGITYPTEGRIAVDGRIAPLIQLGAGFHSELTGAENVYLNGSILGMRCWLWETGRSNRSASSICKS